MVLKKGEGLWIISYFSISVVSIIYYDCFNAAGGAWEMQDSSQGLGITDHNVWDHVSL